MRKVSIVQFFQKLIQMYWLMWIVYLVVLVPKWKISITRKASIVSISFCSTELMQKHAGLPKRVDVLQQAEEGNRNQYSKHKYSGVPYMREQRAKLDFTPKPKMKILQSYSSRARIPRQSTQGATIRSSQLPKAVKIESTVSLPTPIRWTLNCVQHPLFVTISAQMWTYQSRTPVHIEHNIMLRRCSTYVGYTIVKRLVPMLLFQTKISIETWYKQVVSINQWLGCTTTGLEAQVDTKTS